LAIDIFTKWYVVNHFRYYLPFVYPYGGVGVFKNFLGIQFSLVYQTNTGAAWGLFSNYPTTLLVVRIAIIIFLFLFYFMKKQNTLERCTLALILAGALGNVVDIFFYGHVVDMFKFVFWGYHYPIFNVADSAILIGLVVYFYYQIKR
jgi:signal peptidase II